MAKNHLDLPDLDELTSADDNNSLEFDDFNESLDSEDLIELNDDDFEIDEELDYTETNSSAFPRLVNGEIIDIQKIEKASLVTITGVDNKTYIIKTKVSEANQMKMSDLVEVFINEEPVLENDNWLFTDYELINVSPNSSLNQIKEQNPFNSKTEKPANQSKLGFFEKIKNEIKNELNENKNHPERFNDEINEEESKNDTPQKEKKSKKKKLNKKNFYVLISNKIYDFILSFLKKLSNIPIIGKLFTLLSKFSFILKLISYLWLIWIILVVMFILSLFGGKQNEVETLTTGETKIEILSKEIDSNEIRLKVKNDSSIYANFYLEAKVKDKNVIPFFGKTVECKSEITVLNIDEQKDIIIKCPIEDKKSTIKELSLIENE